MPVDSPHTPDSPGPSGHSPLRRRGFLLASGAALAAAPAHAAPAATEHTVDAPAPAEHAAGEPDFGPNVHVFDPSMSAKTIQKTLDEVYAQQKDAEFGAGRFALLFKPGGYDVDVNVGFYTQVVGLGIQPHDTSVTGSVQSRSHGNATTQFWRGVENLFAVPKSGLDRWAVSQATFYRRMYLLGDLRLDDGGFASGGFIADSLISGQVNSGTQQQWLTRNSRVGHWVGSNWNMVFVGVENAPATSFPAPPYTSVPRTPVVREKPFLHVDAGGAYHVFVPAVRRDSQGLSWEGRKPAGTSAPIGDFHIARPGATAADLNAALARGKHLLFTPGVYELSATLKVIREDTVVLGLGLATLVAPSGAAAIEVADVDGVKLAGLLVDAGATAADALIRMGPEGSRGNHRANPSSLHDVFVRIGGDRAGKAKRSLVVNSHDVIIDHIWLWRADHGTGTGWEVNTSDEGLVVTGDDVTAYGLFVEHHQKSQVRWLGERGRTYFFQNEMPYDPPNQAAWMDGRHRGHPAYRVGDAVREHEAWGLGSYCVFAEDRTIVADRAFAAPRRPGVRFHSMITFTLGGGQGTIAHVINTTGGPSDAEVNLALLTSYP